MKLEYVLREIDTKEKETVFVTSYLYKARDKAYTGISDIKIGGENSKQILDNLGIGDSIGDIITVDFNPKNTQTSLKTKPGKAVD